MCSHESAHAHVNMLVRIKIDAEYHWNNFTNADLEIVNLTAFLFKIDPS